MGIDLNIALKVKEGVDFSLASGVNHSIETVAERLRDNPREGIPEGATHMLRSIDRYWDPDYRRGSWPDIMQQLVLLLADPDVEKVWYYGDNVSNPGDKHLVTLEKVFEYTQAYVTGGMA